MSAAHDEFRAVSAQLYPEHIVKDDHGKPHTYAIKAHMTRAAFALWSKVDKLGGRDYLDHVLDAAMGEVDQEQRDPVREAIESAANRVLASGDESLMLALFAQTDRDQRSLTPGEIDIAFAGNGGEMVRAVKLVLAVNFTGFFAERVAPLRGWGQRIATDLKALYQKASSSEYVRLATTGLSGVFGMAAKGEHP